MKNLKRVVFTLALTALVMSCVPESANADQDLYKTSDQFATEGEATQGGGD